MCLETSHGGVHEAGLPDDDYNDGEQIRVEERSQGAAGARTGH